MEIWDQLADNTATLWQADWVGWVLITAS